MAKYEKDKQTNNRTQDTTLKTKQHEHQQKGKQILLHMWYQSCCLSYYKFGKQ